MVLMPIEVEKPTGSNCSYEVSTRTPNNNHIYLYAYYTSTPSDPSVAVTLYWIDNHLPLFYELWKEHDFNCYL